MITSIKFFKLASLAVIATLTMSSCATMFSGKTTPVVLVNCPKDLIVKENGSTLSIERVKAHVKGNLDESTTTYYAAGVELDKKVKRHTLELTSEGKTNTVEIKLGAGGKWVIVNLFGGGVIGWGVDAATKKWRVAKNKYIDVPAVIGGTKPQGQGKLKRIIKKQAKG
ncbi:MAG: hypothetical protein Q8M29_14200 [Bacteroidota bacterium]|nr:hypothetical protein [Bacteroidota bacterium]